MVADVAFAEIAEISLRTLRVSGTALAIAVVLGSVVALAVWRSTFSPDPESDTHTWSRRETTTSSPGPQDADRCREKS